MAITIRKIACPEPPVGADLMKTGQTTSYRTGDDGDIEAGRDVDFFTLSANNPFGNTNRFTDELGGQTYTNDIVIDWSTYNGTTVLGYYRVSLGLFNWNDAIDACLSHTIGTFTSGWRLWNIKEANNVLTSEYTNNALEYSPFNQTRIYVWTSNTNSTGTTQALRIDRFLHIQAYVGKTLLQSCIAVRTFTVTGTTLT